KLPYMWKRLETALTPSQTVHPGTWPDGAGLSREHIGFSGRDKYGPYELLRDLRLIQESLLADGEADLARGQLAKLIRQVEVFGFHFAALDVRQHSERHAAALAELVQVTGLCYSTNGNDYMKFSEAERVALLEY